MLRERMRQFSVESKSSSVHAYREEIVRFLNQLFYLPPTRISTFWNVEIKKLIMEKFYVPQAGVFGASNLLKLTNSGLLGISFPKRKRVIK